MNPITVHIPQLLKDCERGKETACKQLYDHLAAPLLTLCGRYIKNPPDAEEVLLDGFRKLFAGLNRFRYTTDAQFYAWARKIMVNECLMFLRKENVFSISIEQSETVAGDSGEEVLNRLSAAEIYAAIRQLPAGYRTVFNLFEIEGYSHREIATALGISEGTSKSQLNKARNWLQQQLTKNEAHAQRKIP